MLEAKSLSYAVGRTRIIQDVSFSLAPGEVVAIVGPNGAGKSTLLRLLAGGDLEPTGGTATLDGVPLRAVSRRTLARRRAVLPQEHTVGAAFPAFEVVLMARSARSDRRETALDLEIAARALRDMNVAHLADRSFPTLSGGERQRVSFARASAQIWDETSERYLMLDEPTNNLDLEHQHVALRRARRWAQDGVGVLVVLHDLNLAAQYADRIVVMHEGRCVTSGPPRSVLTPGLVRDVFRTIARIEDHPCFDCPLVVTLSAVEREYTTEEYHELNS